MLAGRNIICLASNWFFDPTSKHHIMTRLAERNHIVWVNYHGSRRVRVSGADMKSVVSRLGQVFRGPRDAAPGITVLTPIILPWPGSGSVRRLNRVILVRQIRKVLRRLPDRPVQVWSFAPDVSHLAGQFGEECLIYYCVDEFSEFAGYDSELISGLEKELIARADLVITTSRGLQTSKQSLHPQTHLVTHGVDYDHFARARDPGTPVPPDVANLPRPILGFFGLIRDWVDLDLLSHVAKRRPDWSIVLIGEGGDETGVCTGLSNVYFLGRRPYAELPGYCRAFDVGLIPFRVNELTRHVNPIKLREYLAAGLPVVSTPLPEVIACGSLVEIADGTDAFIAACERAMAGNSPDHVARRQTAMQQETWAAKVEHLSRLVEGVLSPSVSQVTGGEGR